VWANIFKTGPTLQDPMEYYGKRENSAKILTLLKMTNKKSPTLLSRRLVMPSAGIEPAFQASEACVLSVALRGRNRKYFFNRLHYMIDSLPLQGLSGLKLRHLGIMGNVEIHPCAA
jgi:hypothetical protein